MASFCNFFFPSNSFELGSRVGFGTEGLARDTGKGVLCIHIGACIWHTAGVFVEVGICIVPEIYDEMCLNHRLRMGVM